MSIYLYDMRLSDKYIFLHLWKKAAQHNGCTNVVLSDLAIEVGCHRNTASRAYRRLVAAGKIETLQSSDRTGYYYRVLSDE